MPLTKKGKEIMKSMQKQYGKKKAEKIFYASKNAGKITGVEKKMKTKKASLGLLIGSQADKVMRKSKGARKAAGSGMFGLTGLAASKYYEKKAGGEIKKLKGGGAAIKGINFKGVF